MRKVYVFLLVQCICFSCFGQNYYRSLTSGPWDQPTTWESSPDNSTWSLAISTPTSADNTITIQSGHTVTVSLPVTVDEVVIKNGAVLEHFAGVLTVNDGPLIDIDINNGGVLLLSSASTSPSFGPGNPVNPV